MSTYKEDIKLSHLTWDEYCLLSTKMQWGKVKIYF